MNRKRSLLLALIAITSVVPCDGRVHESGQQQHTLLFKSEASAVSVPGYRSFYFDSTRRHSYVALLVTQDSTEHLVEVTSTISLNPVKVTSTFTISGWSCRADISNPDVHATTFADALDGIVPGERQVFTFSCDDGFSRSDEEGYSADKQYPTVDLLSESEARERIPSDLYTVAETAVAILGPDIENLSESFRSFESTATIGWHVTAVLAKGLEVTNGAWNRSKGPDLLGYEDIALDPRLEAVLARLNRSIPPAP